MKNPLLQPARCAEELPADLTKPYLVAEPKIDGSRYILYLGSDPYERRYGHTLLSRYISKVDNRNVDRTDNVPHIVKFDYLGLDGTILDGEIQASNFLETNSIMNSSPMVAIKKQNEVGRVFYHVFDVMFFRGVDVRGKSLIERRKILEAIVKRMNNEYIKLVPMFNSDIADAFAEITANGGEGLIVKDLRRGYGSGWSKMKKSYDVSCVITGFKSGNGKYESSIGSIALSVWKDGKLFEVGYASGFSDEIRNQIAKHPESFIDRVVDVFCHELQMSKLNDSRLRHPTFHRFRDDLNSKDCTYQKLVEDTKLQALNNRKKFAS